jgi:hypothetical protein
MFFRSGRVATVDLLKNYFFIFYFLYMNIKIGKASLFLFFLKKIEVAKSLQLLETWDFGNPIKIINFFFEIENKIADVIPIKGILKFPTKNQKKIFF